MLLYIFFFFLYHAICWLFHLVNFANALHDLHLQPARVRLPPWVDGVVCKKNVTRTFGILHGAAPNGWWNGPTVGTVCRVSGRRALSGEVCTNRRLKLLYCTVDSRLFPNSIAKRSNSSWREQEHAREERESGRTERACQQLLSARSLCLCVRLCAWICSLSHCCIYYQQTAMPVTS